MIDIVLTYNNLNLLLFRKHFQSSIENFTAIGVLFFISFWWENVQKKIHYNNYAQ